MALFSRVHTWVSNEVLTAADLNNEFNNLLTNSVATSIVGYSASVPQMQTVIDPGAVGTESLAASVAEEISRIRYMLKFLSGKANWYDHTGRSLAAGALAIQSADIGAGQLTNSMFTDKSIAITRLLNRAVVLSTSCGVGYTNTTTTLTDVTNLSVSITTTGGPVLLMLVPDGTLEASIDITTNTSGLLNGVIAVVRGVTVIGKHDVGASVDVSIAIGITQDAAKVNNLSTPATISVSQSGPATETIGVSYPPSSIMQVDTPAAGTYVYKIQASRGSRGNGTVSLTGMKLLAMEL